jgi:XrtJ-associated TM-motif-TM protein
MPGTEAFGAGTAEQDVQRGENRMQRLKLAVFVMLLLFTATVVQAQEVKGCADSPENPTVVFGFIAPAAAFVLARVRNRKNSRDR